MMADDWSSEGTARSTRFTRPPPAAVGFELHVQSGPDAGRTFPLEPESVLLVGRSPVCALHLSDETVAARHCSLAIRGGELRLLDLSPQRETWVNGVCAHEAYLTGGETICVGQTTLVVRPRTGPAASPDVLEAVVSSDVPFVRARHEVLAEFERRYVDRALERAGQSVARAAANSGIAHRYFQVLKSRRKTP